MNLGNGNGVAPRKVLLATSIGYFVETYDFLLYGFLATTLATVFFPKSNPTAALLATFGIFAVGFLARPLGGIFFGHLGDKFGRRLALLVSVSLMSFSTLAVGLLPGHAQIGTLAPVLLLLCRLLQGFSVGGEFTGAAVFILEHTPWHRRGRYASINYAIGLIGVIVGAMAAVVMTSTTTSEQLDSWGWRVPFLLAAPLALSGVYLRLRVEDSPVFTALRAEGEVESAPLVQAFKVAKKPMLVLLGWAMAPAVASYLLSTFLVSYLTTSAKFSNSESLLVVMVAELVAAAGCLVAGFAIDAFGRKPVAIALAAGIGAWSIPTFAFVQHSSLLGAFLVLGIFAFMFGGLPVITTLASVELFPVHVRASASALSYNVAYVLFAGTAPYVATWLVARGHPLAPGYYLAGLCAIAAVAAVAGLNTLYRDGRVAKAPSEGKESARA